MFERVRIELVSMLDGEIVLVLQRREALLEQSVGGALQFGVQGRVYAQASGVEELGPVLGYDLSADVLDEVGAGWSAVAPLGYAQWHRVGDGGFVGRDGAVCHHHREDQTPAHLGPLGVSPWGVATRVLREPRDERGLCQVQLRRRDVVEVLSGRLHAVGSATEVDLVEVELDDPVLRVGLFDAQGEKRLLELPRQADLRCEEKAARELLCDRACSLNHPPRTDVRDGGAEDRVDVDAPVLPELAVLGGDDGVDQIGRDVVEPDHDTVLSEELVEDLSVAVVDGRADRRLNGFQ